VDVQYMFDAKHIPRAAARAGFTALPHFGLNSKTLSNARET